MEMSPVDKNLLEMEETEDNEQGLSQELGPMSLHAKEKHMQHSKALMGDPRCARVDRCINSKGKPELCWCPLESVYCARQSKNRDSFFAAIRQGRLDVVNFLTSHDNCERERISHFNDWYKVRDKNRRCAIHAAVKYKKTLVLSALLEIVGKEPDAERLINVSDNDGMTALLEASKNGDLQAAKMLRAAGAPWTIVNNENMNGRDIALAEGHQNIVALYDEGSSIIAGLQSFGHDGESEKSDDGNDTVEPDAEAIQQTTEIPIATKIIEQIWDHENKRWRFKPLAIEEQELQDRCDIIIMHPVLESISRDHVYEMAKECGMVKYRRNEVILGPESTVESRQCLIFVLSGEVRVQKSSNDRHDVLLEEGGAYGDRALILGEVATDIVTANKDCYVMILSKPALEPIFRENSFYSETVGASLAAQYFRTSQSGKAEVSEMEIGEYFNAKELEQRIFSFYEIPIVETSEEEEMKRQRRKRRVVSDVPLLSDMMDTLPNKLVHTHEFGIDHKVNDRLWRTTVKFNEEYIYKYLDACQKLEINPLQCIMLQIRHSEDGYKVLDFQGVNVTSSQALALSAALSYKRKFAGINLSNNPIFDKGCVNSESLDFCGVVNAIEMNSCMRTIVLARTRISTKTACELGRVLKYHETLAKLDLSNNALRDEGIKALAKGLIYTKSLTDLNLSNTKGTVQGAEALADSFRVNKTLEIVNLSWNSFLSKGCTVLLQDMKFHPKLEELHFEWNLLGHSGGVAFGQLLLGLRSLKRVDVSHCAIPESATDSICAGLANNNILNSLHLQFNPLKDGVPRIRNTISANKNWQEVAPKFRLDHCDFDVCDFHAAVVTDGNPTGHYKFDLSNAVHRQELQKLISLGSQELGENWRNETLNGERFNWPKNQAWSMPAKGILELDFVHMARSEEDILPEDQFKNLQSTLNRAVSAEDRIDIIKQACGVFRILGEDALSVMYSLNRASEREEALMAMFAKMAGREASMPKILLSCFSQKEVEHIQHRLGTYYAFNSYRPEGKYRFDIGKRLEIDALMHLITIKQTIGGSEFKSCKLFDLKSRTRWTPVDKVEDLLEGSNMPDSGILEFDFDIPDTEEAREGKKRCIQTEVEKLERTRSASRLDQPMSLASLGFDYDAQDVFDDDDDCDDEQNKKGFDYEGLLNRTRTEYKIVTVLHPEKEGLVRCPGMTDKHFNAKWDGGKTTIVCLLEDKEQTHRVQVMTPRGVNEYTTCIIGWNAPFKTTLDIGPLKEAMNEQEKKSESSALHMARLKKFEGKMSCLLNEKTVPKKGGKGLRPVTPETFSNVKNLDFGLALRRSQGVRMYKAWTGFVRRDPEDFQIHPFFLKAMSQHKDVGGVVSKKVTGTLGPSSCINYEIDLSMLVSMHTVPRYFSFQVTPLNGAHLNLYVSTRSLPWENDYMWKGELTETGERIVVVRPTDKNFINLNPNERKSSSNPTDRKSKYYVSIISTVESCNYEFLVEVAPYLASLKTVATVKFPRFCSVQNLAEKTKGLAVPKRVGAITTQNTKTGKMLATLMTFTQDRKSKSCFGAAVPGKAIMIITGQEKQSKKEEKPLQDSSQGNDAVSVSASSSTH